MKAMPGAGEGVANLILCLVSCPPYTCHEALWGRPSPSIYRGGAFSGLVLSLRAGIQLPGALGPGIPGYWLPDPGPTAAQVCYRLVWLTICGTALHDQRCDGGVWCVWLPRDPLRRTGEDGGGGLSRVRYGAVPGTDSGASCPPALSGVPCRSRAGSGGCPPGSSSVEKP